MSQMQEFAVDFSDGRQRRLWAPSFEIAAEVAHAIGHVQCMDYVDCLYDPAAPEYLPLQSGDELGIYD